MAVPELPPANKPDGPDVQWVPGYWAWDDERQDFIWVSGFWRVPPPDLRGEAQPLELRLGLSQVVRPAGGEEPLGELQLGLAADRRVRPEYGDDYGEAVSIQREAWPHQPLDDVLPGNGGEKNDGDVAQKHQCEPFEIGRIPLIRNEKLQGKRQEREQGRVDMPGPAQR